MNSQMKDWKVIYAVRKPIADFASKSQNSKRQITNMRFYYRYFCQAYL